MKKGTMLVSLFLFALSLLCGNAEEYPKTCANVPPIDSAHTFRYAVNTNQSLREEAMAHYYKHAHHHHHHLHDGPAAWTGGGDLFSRSRKMLKQEDYSPPRGVLRSVSLHDVRFHPDSLHHTAQNTNLEYLLMFDVDRLIWSFRKTAGLPTPGLPYGGWEAPYIELRGHFVGHYLSASAHMWASTHNEVVKEKMDALVGNLSLCQKEMNTGYLSAFPTELFDRLEALHEFVWAPYYTVHKIMAGLLDQYTFGENEEALRMVTWMADYFYERVMKFVEKHTVPKFYEILNDEFGGMNDVLYRIYNFTGKSKYRTLAHMFDKPCFFGLLATKSGDITGLHGNTHVAVVIGGQMRYEILGDPLYKEISTYFLDLVNTSHAFATGGTTYAEHWQNPDRMGDVLQSNTEESCSSYNMLKVARNLYRWTKDVSYADYYERTLTNGVLSIQRGTEPGVMIYMFPQGRGVSKAISNHGWGLKFDSFWCCYGTGIESFSKLGDSIYFEEQETKNPSLYIAQYISSTFNWKSANILLNQTVSTYSSYDPFVRVTFTFSPHQGEVLSSTLNLRIPTWTYVNDTNALLNKKPLQQRVNGGSYLTITRKWSASDNLTLIFPITPRLEPIKDTRPEFKTVNAIIYGPFLLVSHTTGDEWDLQVPELNMKPQHYLHPIPPTNHTHLFTFSQLFNSSNSTTFVLTNLNFTDNKTLTMETLPQTGTVQATHATFNLVLLDDYDNNNNKASLFEDINGVLGKPVLLEPVHLPGRHLVHQGPEKPLLLSNSTSNTGSDQASHFRVVLGLDGRNDSVSIESVSNKGCFLHSGVDYSEGEEVKLTCKSDDSSDGTTLLFNKAVSFVAGKGLKQYHPISFIAKGLNTSYLMEPIHSFADELYTPYLNIHP